MNFNIDYNNKYTCTQMLDKLIEDSSLSFICEKEIYFIRKGKLLKSSYIEVKGSCDVKEAKEFTVTMDMLNKTFYLTDLFISNIVFETKIQDVAGYLLDGHIVMLSINDRTWAISIEDNEVFLDYSDMESYVNENNYKDYFTQDIVAGILEGQWFVIDEEASE